MLEVNLKKVIVDREVVSRLKAAIKDEAGYSPDWWTEFAKNLNRHAENDFRPVGESPILTRSIDLFTAKNKDNPDLFHWVREEVESWLDLQYFQRSSGQMKPAVAVTDKQREMIAAYFDRINE